MRKSQEQQQKAFFCTQKTFYKKQQFDSVNIASEQD